MIRKTLILAALCALAAMSLAASAPAMTFVRSGSPTGPLYTGPIHAFQVGTSSLTATDNSGKNVSCNSGTAAGTLGTSSGNPVTGTLTALTFTNCTSNTFPVITSCHVETVSPQPGVVNVTSSAAGVGSMVFTSITVNCDSGSTLVCKFAGTNITGAIGAAPGGIANGEHITFTNAGPVTSSSFGCPTSAHFNGTFGPITAGSGSATKVYVNTV